jgi:hypothetical protein
MQLLSGVENETPRGLGPEVRGQAADFRQKKPVKGEPKNEQLNQMGSDAGA